MKKSPSNNIILIIITCLFFSFYSCKEAKKATTAPVKTTPKKAVPNYRKLKTKVGKNTYSEAKTRTLFWFKKLVFDPQVLVKKKYNIQKHLAEYLGLARLLYNSAKTPEEKKEIKDYITKVYQFTLQPSYHNLDNLDAKTFKANSMSYLRILFLLDNFGFDTNFYHAQVQKIKAKLDNHLSLRGDWQKWAFDNYYTALKLKKPKILNGIDSKKGIINLQIPAEEYSLNQAYELTHLVFAAYNYGASKTQNKFNATDFSYIKKTLDVLSKKYRLKNNRDILSELVTSMAFIKSKSSEFKTATKYLLRKQNFDGTWGNYEKARIKYGDLIKIKLYLHTTLVVYESLVVQFEN